MDGSLENAQDSLTARLRTADRTAALECVDLYYRPIYLFMRRLGHSRQVSEDLTQESFLHAWQHVGQLRNGKALNYWLYRIAGNASKMHWRSHKRDRSGQLDVLDLLDRTEAKDAQGEYNSEELVRLQQAVSQLPFKLRQAVVLHYMQQLTIAESAKAAEIRLGTFKSRLNRALMLLRNQMDS